MVSTVDGTVRDVPVVEGAVVIEVTGFSDGLTTEVTDGLSTEGRGGERGRGERGRGRDDGHTRWCRIEGVRISVLLA